MLEKGLYFAPTTIVDEDSSCQKTGELVSICMTRDATHGCLRYRAVTPIEGVREFITIWICARDREV